MTDSTSNNQNNDTQNQNNDTSNQNTSNNASSYSGGGKKFVIGADGGCAQEDFDRIAKGIQDCGNTVEQTTIGPNQEAYLQGHGADVAVYFCNGVAPATIWSFVHNAIKPGSLPFTIFAYPGWAPYHTEEGGELTSIETIRKVPYKNEWDADQFMGDENSTSSQLMQSEGNGSSTLGDFLDQNSQYVAVCWGASPEELAQNICSGACGGGGSGSGAASTGGSAQIKDKTFEHCIRRICAATDSVFLVENNAAILFPYTDWMAFTLRQQINQVQAKEMDPDLFSIEYNNEGFYNKVTTVYGADEEKTNNETDKDTKNTEKTDKQNEEEKTNDRNTTKTRKTMPTGGTQLSEQYDPLVKIYGELEKKVTTNFPDEETAQYVTNALLIQYIRDFNNSCRVRALSTQKYIGGTFYAVQNPNTKESELFYLNSYTMAKKKNEPLTTDMEFKYGPEGAEELLDYQAYGGGGEGIVGGAVSDLSNADAIWKHAANFCHFWSCPELQEAESETQDPKVAEDYVNKKEKAGVKKIGLSCYGMSSWLYYQFNNKANIPCRVIGNSSHHVVELYTNNSWYKPIQEYRQLDEGFRYDEFCKGNAPVVLDAPNSPAGNNTNSNPSGNTANQNK